MQCKSCGGHEFYVKHTATHIGLYCASAICNKWNSWIGKKALGNYAHLRHYGVDETPQLVYPQGYTGASGFENTPTQAVQPNSEYSYPNQQANFEYGEMPPYEPQALTPEEHRQHHLGYEEQPSFMSYIPEPVVEPMIEPVGYATQTATLPPVTKQPTKQISATDLCVACVSGVIPDIQGSEMFSMQFKKKAGLILMVNKRTNDVVYSVKVAYCPVCGGNC